MICPLYLSQLLCIAILYLWLWTFQFIWFRILEMPTSNHQLQIYLGYDYDVGAMLEIFIVVNSLHTPIQRRRKTKWKYNIHMKQKRGKNSSKSGQCMKLLIWLCYPFAFAFSFIFWEIFNSVVAKMCSMLKRTYGSSQTNAFAEKLMLCVSKCVCVCGCVSFWFLLEIKWGKGFISLCIS